MQRTVKSVFPALRDDIDDLTTYRALPTPLVEMIDPFLFLNHHGRQTYPPDNNGLPFGPHPHRGFCTLTFILEGDIAHRDSGGHESVIDAGGVQWMTAGAGLVHSEQSSAAFKQSGGPLEILQLWINLPSRLKMMTPSYTGLQRTQIPVATSSDGKVQLQLIAGSWQDQRGALQPPIDMTAILLRFQAGSVLTLDIAATRNVFFYVIRGRLQVNGHAVEDRQLVEFGHGGTCLQIKASTDAVLLLCHAEPLGEPVARHGPFVMNTQQEIRQALLDYQNGTLR